MGWIYYKNEWIWKDEPPRKTMFYKVKGLKVDPRMRKTPTTPLNNNKGGLYGYKISSEQTRWAGDMYLSLYRAYTQKYNLRHKDAVRMARFGVSHEAEESGYGSSLRTINNNYGGFTTGKLEYKNMDDFAEAYAETMLYNYPNTLNAKNMEEYIHALYTEKWKDGKRKVYNNESEDSYYNKIKGNWKRSLYGINWWLYNNSKNPNPNFKKIDKYHANN